MYAHYFGESLSREECKKCQAFYEEYRSNGDDDVDEDSDDKSQDAEDRLMAIMENIIANNGEFIL